MKLVETLEKKLDKTQHWSVKSRCIALPWRPRRVRAWDVRWRVRCWPTDRSGAYCPTKADRCPGPDTKTKSQPMTYGFRGTMRCIDLLFRLILIEFPMSTRPASESCLIGSVARSELTTTSSTRQEEKKTSPLLRPILTSSSFWATTQARRYTQKITDHLDDFSCHKSKTEKHRKKTLKWWLRSELDEERLCFCSEKVGQANE